ncbi:MAG: pyrroline-5-carboxylate reductase [Actinomycetaceae bacterium]|nr:pyrroline-5-carboxylate reductase [Actinomycetaceae bacterium]
MKVGIIGTGNMGGAIARGVGKSADFALAMFDPNTASAKAIQDEVGGQVTADAAKLVTVSDIIVGAVKPHLMGQVLGEIAADLDGKIVVSIAAGRPLKTLQQDVQNAKCQLFRAMPNVNAIIGKAMTGVAGAPGTSQSALNNVVAMFETCGHVEVIPEEHFAVYAAIAGCSPAWVFTMVDSLARAAVAHGIPKAQAVRIAAAAVGGSGDLARYEADQGIIPAALVDRVTSPGGTTVAGLLAAEDAGFSPAIRAAVDAAVDRDNELAEG